MALSPVISASAEIARTEQALQVLSSAIEHKVRPVWNL